MSAVDRQTLVPTDRLVDLPNGSAPDKLSAVLEQVAKVGVCCVANSKNQSPQLPRKNTRTSNRTIKLPDSRKQMAWLFLDVPLVSQPDISVTPETFIQRKYS